MSKENIREIACDALIEITEKGAMSHLLMRDLLAKYEYLEKRDRSLLLRLVDGTLEEMLRLDYILGKFSRVPVKKLKPMIRAILRVSLYQMCFLDSIPDSAICNEAVKIAKKRGFSTLSGFVNGVLRSVAREKEKALELPELIPGKETEVLSIAYSYPEWIVKHFSEAYGIKTTIEILRSMQKTRPLQIRANTTKIAPEELWKKLAKEGVAVDRSPYLPLCAKISGFDRLTAIPSFEEGLFYVQDISSQLVAVLADPKKDDLVLDVCAAPGGKSLHMAEMMQGGTGKVIARDLTLEKTEIIRDNAYRCGLTNVEVQEKDALEPDPEMIGKADVVLADLPCSGLGVLGRKKDMKYKVTENSLKELARLQKDILSVAVQYVRPGGTLIYSTCTINREENEDNRKYILDMGGFEAVSLNDLLPEVLHGATTKEGYLQLLPGVFESDGFFISKYRKVK